MDGKIMINNVFLIVSLISIKIIKIKLCKHIQIVRYGFHEIT